ncbi:TonB-dependent siderophore receptor [Ochrobactrum sp. EDr1-4]|uniref:TonB-dependent siderophore receptor n=1 Tax=Ochrobactrum sp. EDr1-4 TaxID=3368622 RepID=UPI003BA112C7
MGMQSGGNRSESKRTTPIWLVASASALTIVAGLAISASSALAQQKTAGAVADASKITLSIPAQSLNTAVLALADRAGLQVFYDADRLKGLRSSGVKGTYSREQAIGILLQGTGVSYRFTGATSVSLVSGLTTDHVKNVENSTVLDTITISGLGSTTEGTGSYTTGAMSTGVKLPLSVKETPQTVTVVTRQKIEDKSYETLDQAVADTPGLIANQNFGDARYQYWSRGLIIDNMQYDGVANPVQYYARDSDGADDMDMYDRVEVLRGASGLVTGAGNPSGAINLMRKRPLDEKKTTITTRASSWGSIKAVLDHSTPLNTEGTVRGRIVSSYGSGQTYKDDSFNKDGIFYSTLEADVRENTTVNLGYSYQKQKIDGYDWGGLPVKTDGSFYDFSPSDFIGNDWQYVDRSQHTAFVELEHRFDNDWKLNVTGRASWSKSEMAASFSSYTGSNLYLYDRLFNYDNDVYAFDANLNGSLEAFGREHDLVLGVNANRTNLTILNSLGPTTLINDPLNWSSSSVFDYSDFKPFSQLHYKTEQIGAYAAGRFAITDSLKLIAGARFSWYDYDATTTILSTAKVTPNQIRENGIFTPYAGVVYDINDTLSAYASYTSIFQPQYNFGRGGDLLNPITGTNIEAGFKGEFFDQRLNGTLAVFQVMRDNVASRLSDVSYCNPTILACYEGVDGVRTRGIELELSGFITDRWRMTGGYTYAVSKYTEGASAGEKFATYQYPEHVFKLFTTYTFPDEHLTIGGGLRAQSKLYYESGAFNVEQPAYAVADVMAKYDFNEQTALQLNVNNLFDKNYYSALNTSAGYGFFMGSPRNFKLTLKHSF